jgi:hypothetical protein
MYYLGFFFFKKRQTDSLKRAQHGKIDNVAGSFQLSLFMDGTGKSDPSDIDGENQLVFFLFDEFHALLDTIFMTIRFLDLCKILMEQCCKD